ncbi:WSC domain-containing protein [Bisporella sp. PMI_857]|nr:WSC domain-containing protein [Bisporella sp. PMI_857]
MFFPTILATVALLGLGIRAAERSVAVPPGVYLPEPGWGWSYAGCWNESVHVNGSGGARTLAFGKMTAGPQMTAPGCFQYCYQEGSGIYTFAGLEYGEECWCSSSISRFSIEIGSQHCNLPCKGNASHICGGSDTLTLYKFNPLDRTLKSPSEPSVASTSYVSALMMLGTAGVLVAGLMV